MPNWDHTKAIQGHNLALGSSGPITDPMCLLIFYLAPNFINTPRFQTLESNICLLFPSSQDEPNLSVIHLILSRSFSQAVAHHPQSTGPISYSQSISQVPNSLTNPSTIYLAHNFDSRAECSVNRSQSICSSLFNNLRSQSSLLLNFQTQSQFQERHV